VNVRELRTQDYGPFVVGYYHYATGCTQDIRPFDTIDEPGIEIRYYIRQRLFEAAFNQLPPVDSVFQA
jgi:hypothetical protein